MSGVYNTAKKYYEFQERDTETRLNELETNNQTFNNIFIENSVEDIWEYYNAEAIDDVSDIEGMLDIKFSSGNQLWYTSATTSSVFNSHGSSDEVYLVTSYATPSLTETEGNKQYLYYIEYYDIRGTKPTRYKYGYSSWNFNEKTNDTITINWSEWKNKS